MNSHTPTPESASARAGFFAAMGAFFIWGLLPLYLKPLSAISAFEITAHRLVWGCLFTLGWLAVRGELGHVGAALRDPAARLRLMASALLISVNWITYAWGVTNGHVVETSLGYFINPLFNVLLGVVVLSERLNRIQWVAVGSAAVGVVYLTWTAGRLPWIALFLAASFGLYGLIRKTVSVDALSGLATETLLIAPIGAIFLLVIHFNGTGAFESAGAGVKTLLLLGGPVTAIPLVLFAYGARRIPYSTVGLLQYIGPTLQLLTGVFLYREPFTQQRAAGFAFIWLALAIYAIDNLWRSRAARRLMPGG